LLIDLEPEVPDLVAAVRSGWVSFDQLVDASEGKDQQNKAKKAPFVLIYPLVRATFERSHGQIVDVYFSSKIGAYSAITVPVAKPWLVRLFGMFSRSKPKIDLPLPAAKPWPFGPLGHRPDFHFIYDLATAPIAGQVFARITQLGYEAKRIVPRARLAECLDQLYSTTTDLMGILEVHGKTEANLEQMKVAIAEHDLDQVELRYLQVTARLLYFVGVICGTGAVVLGALLIGVSSGLDSVGVTAVMFAAIGALLSVVQKMADDTLTVRYVVGPLYLFILGFVRPIIGGFAGLLLQLAMAAGVIPLSKSGAAGNAYTLLLGFAIGFAERSIPDVFSRAGVSTGLPPMPSGAGTTSTKDPGSGPSKAKAKKSTLKAKGRPKAGNPRRSRQSKLRT
jgi:hypothetical protein